MQWLTAQLLAACCVMGTAERCNLCQDNKEGGSLTDIFGCRSFQRWWATYFLPDDDTEGEHVYTCVQNDGGAA